MSEVVVVTGASSGVGRAAVRAFANAGADVGLIARPSERLEEAKREVEKAGRKAVAASADVADPDQVQAAADRIERDLGPIDVWVNDAMTTVFSRFIEITPEEFKRATEVTYLGTVYGTLAALRSMYPRNQGSIVQVGSALAYRSIPLQSPYCGAKHAIAGFTDSIRTELIHDHKDIHITMVQLPAMNTPQFSWCKTRLPRHPQPVPPVFQPEVAADAIVWAAHHRRRQVYVGAPTLFAIWANKIAPHWLDKYLGDTGYDSQQTDQPVDPNRPVNLFKPVEADYAAHGVFDNVAHEYSVEAWGSLHKPWLSAAGAVLAGVMLAAIVARR